MPSEQALSSLSESEVEIAIVAVEAAVGGCEDLGQIRRALELGDWQSLQTPVQQVTLDGAWVKFPPKDLEQALPQQNLLLRSGSIVFSANNMGSQKNRGLGWYGDRCAGL